MPKKIRVYELARELGLTNKEALDLCVSLGIGVKSHSSSIEDAQADRVRRKADSEGLRRAVQPEEPVEEKAAAKTAEGAGRAGRYSLRPLGPLPATGPRPSCPPRTVGSDHEPAGQRGHRPAFHLRPPSADPYRPGGVGRPAGASGPRAAPGAVPGRGTVAGPGPPVAGGSSDRPARRRLTPGRRRPDDGSDPAPGPGPTPGQRHGQVHPPAPGPSAFQLRASHPPAPRPPGTGRSAPRRPSGWRRTTDDGWTTDHGRPPGPFRWRRRVRRPPRRLPPAAVADSAADPVEDRLPPGSGAVPAAVAVHRSDDRVADVATSRSSSRRSSPPIRRRMPPFPTSR